MTLTNENIHYCSAWAFHQLEWLERYTRDELVIKAKDLYVAITTNMEQYELIESIILLRWKDHLGQTEDSWQQLSNIIPTCCTISDVCQGHTNGLEGSH